MVTEKLRDEENPAVRRSFFFGLIKNPDPARHKTLMSYCVNAVLSNMVVYGVTGNGRLATLAALISVPCSMYLCYRDVQHDYEKWKELRVIRLKGVPEKLMPYRCKYDWEEFEKRRVELEIEKAEKELERTSKTEDE